MKAVRQDDGRWLIRKEYDAFGVKDSFGLVKLPEFEEMEISDEDRKQLRKDIEKNCRVNFIIFCDRPGGEYSLWFHQKGVLGLHKAFKNLLEGGVGWVKGGIAPNLDQFYEYRVAYYEGTLQNLAEKRDFLNCSLTGMCSQLFGQG